MIGLMGSQVQLPEGSKYQCKLKAVPPSAVESVGPAERIRMSPSREGG